MKLYLALLSLTFIAVWLMSGEFLTAIVAAGGATFASVAATSHATRPKALRGKS